MANYVKGQGSLTSKIFIIGEAPGERENETGVPFAGGSGMVLNGLLAEAGIRREDCYVDNVVRYQPPANNFGIYYQDKSRENPTGELLQAHEALRQLIIQHRPNVVVPLGAEALYAITGKKQITRWRGSILSLDGIKVIPTYHPASIMRQYDWRPSALFDLTKAKRESASPEFPYMPADDFAIHNDFDTTIAVLDALKTCGYLAFDIETSQELRQILCIAFAWSNYQATSIPIFHGNKSAWSHEEEFAIVKKIKEVMEVPQRRLIAHNANFDCTYLKYRWGIDCMQNLWMDTMVAHHCVYPELQKSLAFCTSIYTNHPYHKDLSGKDLLTYNCMDAARTYECAFEIKKELEDFGTWNFYQEKAHRVLKPLFDMQLTGCRIDMNAKCLIAQNLTQDLDVMQKRLDQAVGYALNVASPKQMKTFLYEDLRLPVQYTKRTDSKTKEKKETIAADDDALEFLMKHYKLPVLLLIQDIREVRKLLSTYILAEVDPDERIRCAYMATGTETGRLSSRESVFGTGTNLQNIPRGPLVRSLFIPDDGYLFVNADLSQAEARVVAYLAEEERLKDIFKEGGDVHRKNASFIFKKRVEEISEEERELGKRLVHAANYGIGVRKFAKTIDADENKARELLNTYYAIYPRIKRWHTEVQEELKRKRILVTPMGRKRMFFGRWNDDLVRSGIAYVPQSTVGDVLNLGLINAHRAMPNGWTFILQNHDAVLFQVPACTDPIQIHKFVHHYFEFPITIGREQLVIPIDIKWGKSWGQLHKMEV